MNANEITTAGSVEMEIYGETTTAPAPKKVATLRLGVETGSVVNWLQSADRREPVVGMPATILHWSDRDPATVVAFDGKTLTTRDANWTIVSGSEYDGSARYEYAENEQGALRYFRRNRRGVWKNVTKGATGRWKFTGNGGLLLGSRERYYDPSF